MMVKIRKKNIKLTYYQLEIPDILLMSRIKFFFYFLSQKEKNGWVNEI
jgi:hypothetical protein